MTVHPIAIACFALMGCTVFARDVQAGDKKPFMAYTWRTQPGVFDNLVNIHWVLRKNPDPARAKAATDAMPEGHRVLFGWHMTSGIGGNREDFCRDANGELTKMSGVWWDKGAEAVAARWDEFFRSYREIGGKVDMLVLDYEGTFGNWAIGRDPARWRAIEADPRFAAIAEQLGFRDLERVRNWRRGTEYSRWNALMRSRVATYLNKAVYEPARRHFPDIRMSNYGHFYGTPPHTCPGVNGHDDLRFSIAGATMHVGTHQSAQVYAMLWQIDKKVLPGGKVRYADTPFNAMRLSVNRMRSMVLSSDVPAQPWISHKRFQKSSIWHTDLYQELIFHIGLCNPNVFLYWNPYVWKKKPGADKPTCIEGQDQLVSDCLHRLDELVGAADRESRVVKLAGWYDDYLLTGMNAGGRAVWRLTPALVPGQDRADVLEGEAPPSFVVGTTTISFPKGKIYAPADELSDQGFWITGPIGSEPVITVGPEQPQPVKGRAPDPYALSNLAKYLRHRYDRDKDTVLVAAELPSQIAKADTDKDDRTTHGELVAWLKRHEEPAAPAAVKVGADEHANATPQTLQPFAQIESAIELSGDTKISDLDVRVQILHQADAFLDLLVIGPGGEEVPLFTGKRKSPWPGASLYHDNITIDDDAEEMQNKSLRPEQSLSVFDGEPVAGKWRLIVRSKRSDRAGVLLGWSLRVTRKDA